MSFLLRLQAGGSCHLRRAKVAAALAAVAAAAAACIQGGSM